ncbi:MAG: FkbM family methyltransferase [Chitinophagaceae bacterium]|nr:FkbM family methyltransferase [Chitinophagaceae bacterium]
MIRRLQQALNKLAFCYSTTADSNTFFTLLVNTKKNKRRNPEQIGNEKPVQYRLSFNKQPKTIYLRTYSGDIAMFYEIFWQKVYEVVINKNTNPHTIIDIGANIGMASLFFSQRFPQAIIYAVEPDADNFEILTENLSEEIQSGNLIPVKAAIADKDGEVYLQKKEYAYNSSVSEVAVSDNKVRAFSMHSFFREMMIEQVDILKIDIEGMEENIFRADTGWLERVNVIVMECHSAAIEQLCRSKLAEYGFDVLKENGLLIGEKKL